MIHCYCVVAVRCSCSFWSFNGLTDILQGWAVGFMREEQGVHFVIKGPIQTCFKTYENTLNNAEQSSIISIKRFKFKLCSCHKL